MSDRVVVSDLIDHTSLPNYREIEMRHSHATRIIYKEFLIRWIKPSWRKFTLAEVRTIAVEAWLRELRRRMAKIWPIPQRLKFEML
jgi:hypothetical protein